MPAAEADRPGKVFVGGLASDIDEAVLEKYFSHYGRLTEVIVKRDKNTQQTRGYAFITFENPYDAEDAIKEMDKKEIHGRQIYVEQAVKPRHETQNLRPPPRGGGFRGAPRGSRGGGRGGGGSRGGPRGRMGDGHMDRSRSPIRQRPDRGRPDRDFSRSDRGGRDGFDGPQRRDFGGDRYGGMDRGAPPRSRDPPMSRGRDYSPSSRDFGRGSAPDRMSRGSARDFQSSRYDPPPRDFSPPPRDFHSSRDMIIERGPTSRDRMSTRDYGSPQNTRDFGGSMSRGGSSMYAGSRDQGMGSREVYVGGRDRDLPSSRDYMTSREFSSRGGSSRGGLSRGGGDFDRGQPLDDSYRDSGRGGPLSRGPPSRGFSSMGSQRDSGRPSHDMYESSNRGQSRGGPSSNRGPPSRGPPPRGVPSRGPPPRDDRDRGGYSTGQRRPSNMDSRGGGPPMKRARPSGMSSRGSMRR